MRRDPTNTDEALPPYPRPAWADWRPLCWNCGRTEGGAGHGFNEVLPCCEPTHVPDSDNWREDPIREADWTEMEYRDYRRRWR